MPTPFGSLETADETVEVTASASNPNHEPRAGWFDWLGEGSPPSYTEDPYSQIAEGGGTLRNVRDQIREDGLNPVTEKELRKLCDWLNKHKNSDSEIVAGYKDGFYYFAFGTVTLSGYVCYLGWDGGSFYVLWDDLGNRWHGDYRSLLK